MAIKVESRFTTQKLRPKIERPQKWRANERPSPLRTHLDTATISLSPSEGERAGVACGDVDGDGWCDIYLCGLKNGNRLYRNLGQWKFEDITESAGVAGTNQYSAGAVFADVDGDGSLDLLVTGLGVGTTLFLNDGKGHFHEAAASGLVRK